MKRSLDQIASGQANQNGRTYAAASQGVHGEDGAMYDVIAKKRKLEDQRVG